MNNEIIKDLNILFVEDEETIQKFTVKFLNKVVSKVFVGSNGQEGFEEFQKNKDEIDIIITDIHMPVLNGLDMIEKIREINSDIPIIITTAYNESDFIKRSVELNVSSYVLKPIDLEQLIKSLIKTAEPIMLRRQLQEAHSKANKNEEYEKLNTIFNSQENMIAIVKNNVITKANKKFYKYFNIESLSSFDSKHIFDFFIDEPGLIPKDELKKSECWAEYIKGLPEIDRIVKVVNNNNKVKIFTLGIEVYLEEEESYILTFADITLLKEKVNLLEYQATHDTLTGIYNRNKFHEMFEKEIRRNLRYKHDLSIIIVDIDHFKKINDTFGHQTGDDVLKAIPIILQSCIREHDILSRWGGEEFMILLPDTNIENAFKVAEKIRAKIESQTFTKRYLSLTASFGVSALRDEDTAENLIKRADNALYESKNQGRNLVTLAK
ncbi:MAG: diguanylate cyclase [Sulfurovum sp.]|jgi:diguanylate cyclase (GGDEF)-like protein|nr:MAG: putative diguanylate cyclase YdaM [Arcobacter lacus]